MSTQAKYPKENVLGVAVDNLTTKAAIAELISRSRGSKPALYVVKPYVEHIEYARKHPQFKRILNQAYLSLPDGVSLNWAVFFNNKTKRHWWDLIRTSATAVFNPMELHLSFPNHAWGTTFTWKLLEAAAARGRRVYIVGSPKNSTIGNTKSYLMAKIGGLKIVGTQDGRDPATGVFSNQLKKALYKDLQKIRPDIILLGIGMPRQEELAAELARKLTHGVIIAEGGTFDYRNFGGALAKAPAWMQKRGLEWLWRLKKNLAVSSGNWQYRGLCGTSTAKNPNNVCGIREANPGYKEKPAEEDMRVGERPKLSRRKRATARSSEASYQQVY